jgi:hypothetical protein
VRSARAALAWHLLTFAVAVFAIVFQFVLIVQGHGILDETQVPAKPEQIRRFFFYFTIQSNLLVAWTCLMVATRDISASRLQRVLRLDAVLGIAVTGVVHFVLLRPLLDLHGASYLADKLLHMAVPALAVIGWLVFGPRGLVSRADVLPALVWPVLWLVVVLATGPVFDWYPYPFVDVSEHGLGVVLLNCLGITVLFLALAFAMEWADRRLPGAKQGDRAAAAA